MKKVISLFLIVIGYFAHCQNTSLEWSAQSSVVSSGRACAVDNFGNIFLTGLIEDGLKENGIYFAKFDSLGNNIWEKQIFSGGSNDGGYSIKCDSENNVYLTGSFRDTIDFQNNILIAYGICDIFILKFNNDGEIMWAKNEGGNSWDWGYSLCLDTEDNLYVTGYFHDEANFSGFTINAEYSNAIFIAKYTTEGQLVWIKHYGGEEGFFANSGNSIIADTNCNIYVTGRFGGNVNFDNFNFNSDGSRDVFLMKMDSTGNINWVRAFGSQSDWDNAFSVALDLLGNVYVTADFYHTITIDSLTITTSEDHPTLIAKFNNNGTIGWINFIVNTGWSSSNNFNKEVVVNNPNNVYLYGTYEPNDNNYDIFLTKYNETGNLLWHEIYSGLNNSFGNYITRGEGSKLFLIGDFIDSLFISDGNLYSDFNSCYVVKINDLTYDPIYTNINNPFIDNELDKIKIYPNPARNYVEIDYYDLHNHTLELFDLKGTRILTLKNNINPLRLNISSFNSGIYYIRFTSNDFIMTKKIVKF